MKIIILKHILGKNKDPSNNMTNGGISSSSSQNISMQEESIFASAVADQPSLNSVLVIKPDAFPRHFIKVCCLFSFDF